MPRNQLSEFDQKIRFAISQNLKKYAGHLTQNQLSDLTGIPASTLSGYFAQRSTPNAGNVQKIADALGVSKEAIDPRFSASPIAISSAPPAAEEPMTITSEKEKSLVRDFRALNEEGKDKAADYISDLKGNDKYTRQDTSWMKEA